MRETKGRYQRIFDSTPMALWENDFTALFEAIDEVRAQGVEDFRRYVDEHPEVILEMAAKVTIEDVNRRTVQDMRLPDKTPLIGCTLDVVTVDQGAKPPAFKEQLIAIASGDYKYEAEDWILAPEGEMAYILFTVTVLEPDADGRWRGLASSLDVTARKRAELSLSAANRELERSNQELEQFAYVASHDLQEPLRTIIGYADALNKRYGDRLGAGAAEDLGRLLDGARRMQAVIGALLELCRLGTATPPMASVDCGRVVAEVVRDLEGVRAELGAQITHDGLPTVVGNETRLSMLFQNLIRNALAYRGDDPPRIHIGARRADDAWIFSVAADGVAIPAAERDVVFRTVHREGDHPGTSIGLAIGKKIVEQHGGRIWLESEVGAGVTIYFSIPAVDRRADSR